jgi:phosphinothricin acetyltransferase
MEKGHVGKVLRIYAEAVAEGSYTFVCRKPDWREWDASHIRKPRLAAEYNGEIAGFAALSQLYRHEYFSGVAELSVYVEKKYRHRGIGIALLEELLKSIENSGFWAIHSYIFPDNLPSVKLHEKAGFRKVGRHKNIGRKHGCFKDVLVYEYCLERSAGKII